LLVDATRKYLQVFEMWGDMVWAWLQNVSFYVCSAGSENEKLTSRQLKG